MHIAANRQAPNRAPDLGAVPPLMDNPFAPDIFVTGISGAVNMNGVVVVTLEAARCDHSQAQGPVERCVVARLALTSAAAQMLVTNLNIFLEAQGLSPSQAIRGGATRQ